MKANRPRNSRRTSKTPSKRPTTVTPSAASCPRISRRRRRCRTRPLPRPFIVVREYAHVARPDRQPGQRSDFTETLYWAAAVKTDPKTGAATVSFDLSDAVTTFRVIADAFSDSGALGAASSKIESVQPFYVEPKLPLEVTSGDVIKLPSPSSTPPPQTLPT